MVLLRTTTLDNWRVIMLACADVNSKNCIDNQTKSCGTLLAYPFFTSFVFLSAFMITNLFLAVIMDNFMYLTLDSSVLYCQHIRDFTRVWTQFDRNYSGRIDVRYLVALLRKVPPPLGFGQLCPRRSIYTKIVAMNLPPEDDNYSVSFQEVLLILIIRSLNLQGQNEIIRKDFYALDRKIDEKLLDRILPVQSTNRRNSKFRIFCASNTIKFHFKVFVDLLMKVRREHGDHEFIRSWSKCIGKHKGDLGAIANRRGTASDVQIPGDFSAGRRRDTLSRSASGGQIPLGTASTVHVAGAFNVATAFRSPKRQLSDLESDEEIARILNK